ncbi:MAG TPA: amino acid ABC transporter permease [Spirochaetia bacterium]|nr:amino acid ABC transporter permease [Spirochaetia bacterium]
MSNFPGSRKRKFTLLDAAILTGIAAAFYLVVGRLRTGLVYEWNWSVIPQYIVRRQSETGGLVAGVLVQGLFTTLRLAFWSSLGALVIGIAIGMMRIAKSRAWQAIGRVYVELVRNTPPLVLVFIFFFFVGNQLTVALGIDSWIRSAAPGTQRIVTVLFSPPARFGEFLSAVFTLAVYEGAYMAEIVRAGILSVEKGQTEAAYALGLTRRDQYRFVILPQALRTMSPALAGQFISAIKDSAIVAVISVQELTFRGLELMSATFRTFEIWITITILYFLLTGGLSFLARLLEHRLRRQNH